MTVSPPPHSIQLAQTLMIDNLFEVLFGNFAESQLKDFKEPIDDEESAEDYGYLSDSDLEDDEDEKVALSNGASKPKVQLIDPFGIPGEDRRILWEEHDERVEKGKVVKIPDVAFVTWVQIRNPLSASLTSLQLPGVSDVPLHECDRIRSVWVRRESQVAKRRDHHTI